MRPTHPPFLSWAAPALKQLLGLWAEPRGHQGGVELGREEKQRANRQRIGVRVNSGTVLRGNFIHHNTQSSLIARPSRKCLDREQRTRLKQHVELLRRGVCWILTLG
jgi:hypothetical protein